MGHRTVFSGTPSSSTNNSTLPVVGLVQYVVVTLFGHPNFHLSISAALLLCGTFPPVAREWVSSSRAHHNPSSGFVSVCLQLVQVYHDNTDILFSGVQRYFDNALFSDVTVVTPSGRKLLCHRLVLASCSRRFATILEQGRYAGWVHSVDILLTIFPRPTRWYSISTSSRTYPPPPSPHL